MHGYKESLAICPQCSHIARVICTSYIMDKNQSASPLGGLCAKMGHKLLV